MDDGFDGGSAQEASDRPRGVPKAKLADIKPDPKLTIFYRPDRNTAMRTLGPAIPRELATIFCDRIHSNVRDNDSHSYVITGGDESAYRQVFDWIKDCADQQNITKFPDIPEPEADPFQPTIEIMLAGERLGIPAGSLSFFLKKRLNFIARKNLMGFDRVREFYEESSKAYELELHEIACASIFNAWWDARLDETVNPELMEELSDMRDDIPQLDEDLHEACKAREAEIRKKWEAKKQQKLAEEQGLAQGRGAGSEMETHFGGGGGGGATGDWHVDNNGQSVAGLWGTAAPVAAATGGWDTTTTEATYDPSSGWQSTAATTMNGSVFSQDDHFGQGDKNSNDYPTTVADEALWNDSNNTMTSATATVHADDNNQTQTHFSEASSGPADWAEEMNDASHVPQW